MEERVYLDARRHGVVLVRPLGRALLIAVLGVLALRGRRRQAKALEQRAAGAAGR